jgi:hypothetical protein
MLFDQKQFLIEKTFNLYQLLKLFDEVRLLVISIGDLVGEMMKNQTNQISFLETYMKDYGLDTKGNSHFSFLG